MGGERLHPAERTVLERRLAECNERVRRLTESERGHRRFVESITEGYFFYRHDREHVYRFLSPSVSRVLGYSPEEYVARYGSLFTDAAINETAKGRTARALAGEQQSTFEVEVFAKDGSARRLEVTEYPVFDESGRVTLIEGIAHDVTEKRRLEARLIELATVDDLTGLFNRRHFAFRLNEAIALARRHGFTVSLAILDLDGLKAVNDSHGHAAGDELIRAAAEILKRQFRKGDTVARLEAIAGRFGGDEFVVAMPYARAEGALVAVERMLATILGSSVEVGPGVHVPLRASVGVAELEEGIDASTLQSRADEALYRAKREGRGRVCVWDPEGGGSDGTDRA